MIFNLWTIILIASASQCVFLALMLWLRPPENRKATVYLFLLLTVILAININNIWYAGYLYRIYFGVAGFAQGMVLLLGPILYFYVRAITDASFQIKANQLLHLVPYFIVFSLIIYDQQNYYASHASEINAVDAFMKGEFPGDLAAILRFSVYFIHLLAYLYMARKVVNSRLKSDNTVYLVPLQIREKWLKTLAVFMLIFIATLILCIVYMVFTGTYSIVGNFVFTLLLSAIVYLIAYQALSANPVLLPNFNAKYGAFKVEKETKDILIEELKMLFEKENIYTEPELTIGILAEKLHVSSHILSRVINDEYNQSFSQLLNQYRIEAFKRKATTEALDQYSIIGIAYDVGYSSKSSFYNAFKKHTGKTPTEFVQSCQ